MKRIDCLFITSSKSKSLQFSIYPYMGVGYLAELLNRKSIKSDLYDLDLNKNNIKKLIKIIREREPKIIGYSIMSISLPIFYKITNIIKEKFPNIIIVAGGPHVTNDPNIIKEMGIDYGFTGHAEISFPDFMKKILVNDYDFLNILGIIIPSINRIDKPAFYDVSKSDNSILYNLYQIEKYQNIFYGKRWFPIISTRGCPYNCSFCKDPGKNKYKEYPLDTVKKQLKFLVIEKKLKWISFVDDTFTFNRERVIEICNWIKNENLKFKWTCCTRADTLDEDLISIMKSAGLSYVIIGVEAGNEEIRRKVNKNISNIQYMKIINNLRKNKIRVLCSYVLGNPDETYSQIKETIKFSNRLKANYAQYYNLTALPQSPIFKYGINENIFEEDAWHKYMKGKNDLPYYIPKNLKLKKLKLYRQCALIIYYLRPSKFFDMSYRLIKFLFDTHIRQ